MQTLESQPRASTKSGPLFPAGLTFSADVTDFVRLAELSPNWRSEYLPLGGGPFSGRIAVAHSANVQLARVEYSRGFSFLGDVPEHTFTFMMPLAGAAMGSFRSSEMSELDVAVAKFGEEVAYHSAQPTSHLVISVAEQLLEGHLDELCPPQKTTGGRLLRFAGAEQRIEFLRDALRALAMARKYPDFLTRDDRASRFEERLIRRLSLAVEPEVRPARGAERHRLARLAHRYLLERVDRNVSLFELCDDLRANERTLLLGFVETYGAGPIAYLRGVRLCRAMRELRSGRFATVTEVATRWGFLHFGRFSAEYRKAFGETPRQTLQNARDEA